ncbi:MAG: shikimate dehydrogenase [Hyphomonadaceae bacterium]|nr:shikimate dehydrogenase [Clostridia bacterium]
MSIDGKTRILAVIGDPIEHTLSPFIHNTLCERYGLNFVYIPLHVKPEALPQAMAGMRAMQFVGANVTIPHKSSMLACMDEVSEEAQATGAVNTVKITDGKLIGHSTDGMGFMRALARKGVSVKGKSILLYGAGGASQSLAVRLASEGVARIVLLNRTLEKAQAIKAVVDHIQPNLVQVDNIAQVDNYLSETDVFIHTTPIGMYPSMDACITVDLKKLPPHAVVCDLIYNPSETKLLEQARQLGYSTMNGWGMLYYQAVQAFEIWTGITVDTFIENPYETRSIV